MSWAVAYAGISGATSAQSSNSGGDLTNVVQQAWSLAPIIVTATLTLLAAFIVQYFVVPKVEERKRREDRWERNVWALGELMSFEQPRKLHAYQHELTSLVFLNFPPSNMTEQQAKDFRKEHAEPLQKAHEDYAELNDRAQWLADRIAFHNRDVQSLRNFWAKSWIAYWLPANALEGFRYGKGSAGLLNQKELAAALRAESVARRTLAEALSKMADGGPPKMSLKDRAERRSKKIRVIRSKANLAKRPHVLALATFFLAVSLSAFAGVVTGR